MKRKVEKKKKEMISLGFGSILATWGNHYANLKITSHTSISLFVYVYIIFWGEGGSAPHTRILFGLHYFSEIFIFSYT